MAANLGEYLVETSRNIHSRGAATVVAEWEHQRVREVAYQQSPDLLCNAVRAVASEFSQQPRDGCPAIVLLLNALSRHQVLGRNNASLYMNIVETFVIPNADYVTQFEGNEHLLSMWRGALQGYVTFAVAHPGSMVPFESLKKATTDFAPSGSHHLTPAHPLLLQLVLSTQANVPQAIALLDATTITEIDPLATGVKLSDFLSYFYYAGILYASVQRWKEAKFAFESSLTVRNYGSNAIMMASYKAYILVSLIADGVVRPLLNAHLDKDARVSCKEYFEVKDAFEKKSFVELNTVMSNHAKVFEGDQLAPLARECHAALLRHSIRSLTKVYVSCSLESIAAEMGTTEEVVHGVLQEMIASNDVAAILSVGAPFTVRFFDPQTVSTSALNSAIAKCNDAVKALEESHQDVLASVQFATHQLRNNPKFSEVMTEYSEQKRESTSLLRKLGSLM